MNKIVSCWKEKQCQMQKSILKSCEELPAACAHLSAHCWLASQCPAPQSARLRSRLSEKFRLEPRTKMMRSQELPLTSFSTCPASGSTGITKIAHASKCSCVHRFVSRISKQTRIFATGKLQARLTSSVEVKSCHFKGQCPGKERFTSRSLCSLIPPTCHWRTIMRSTLPPDPCTFLQAWSAPDFCHIS